MDNITEVTISYVRTHKHNFIAIGPAHFHGIYSASAARKCQNIHG